MAAMMLPPDGREPLRPARYDVPRGTCPRCGTDQVVHLVIGMPSQSDDARIEPTWATWIGCRHPGFDRSCAECGHTWDSGLETDDDGH